MEDRALALATAQLDPGDREVQVVWSGAVDRFSKLDSIVSPEVRSVTGERPVAAMLFREASIQGRLVNLRAATTSTVTCASCRAGCRRSASRRTARCCD